MIALHNASFRFESGSLLEIEWGQGSAGDSADELAGQPNVASASREAKLDALGQRGVPALCWRQDREALFEPFQLRENAEYLIDITLNLSRAEAEAAWHQSRTWPLGERLTKFYKTDPPKRWSDTENGVRITGSLNFGSYVGIADLSLGPNDSLRAEVACAKIGYFADFKALLEQIAEEFVGLLFQVDSPTYALLSLEEAETIPPSILLFHLRRVMSPDRLPTAIETILQSMHSSMTSLTKLTPLPRLQNPAPDLIPAFVSVMDFEAGGPLARLFGGMTPTTLPERLKRETLDTPENRYVKSFLEDLLQMTEQLASRLYTAKRPTSAGEVENWCEQISDLLSRDSWRDVGAMRQFPGNSQILLKRQGYREVLETDLVLQYGVKLPWNRGAEIGDGLDGELRPISELYEYWCFFVLRTALRELCGAELPRKSSLIHFGAGGIDMNLRRGIESKVVFNYRPLGKFKARVSLFFNREFRRNSEGNAQWEGSYSASFHPDYSILIELPAGRRRIRHWLHFDAKYRLDIRQWQSEVEANVDNVESELLEEASGMENLDTKTRDTFKRADLYKMHTYRDSLLGSRGAYILFPGTGESEDIFIRHPGERYGTASFSFPSVGAFQLRPTASPSQRSVITDFLESVLGQLTTGVAYQEETGLF